MSRLRPLLPAVLLLAAAFLLTACPRPGRFDPVSDLVEYPQSAKRLAATVSPEGPGQPLIPAQDQALLAERFLVLHYGPWHRDKPAHAPEDLFWGLSMLARQSLFGENLLPLDQTWRDQMRELAGPHKALEADWPAVATANSSLRLLPTMHPAFYDPRDPGEGFPFDYLQNSTVWAGTPLYVAYLSSDRAWALVESRFAAGWMPVTDLARVDQETVTAMEQTALVAVTRDLIPLVDNTGQFRFMGRVGMLLPAFHDQDDPDSPKMLLPVRGVDGDAVLVPAPLPEDLAVYAFPVPLTPAAVSSVADSMMGQPYGWGGLYLNRDCSATLMDLFADFGIFLPRNSKAQAAAGRTVALAGLDDEAKIRTILAQGKPLRTLLYKPGHILLYLGPYRGRPAVLHTVWGLRTDRKDYPPGRKIIGATAITGLEPGQDNPDVVWPQGSLLRGLTTMTVLGEAP